MHIKAQNLLSNSRPLARFQTVDITLVLAHGCPCQQMDDLKANLPDQRVVGDDPQLHHAVVDAFQTLSAQRIAESLFDDCSECCLIG